MNFADASVNIKDRWVRIIGIPIIGFIMPFLFFNHHLDRGLMAYLPHWFVSTVYTFIYYEGNRFIFIQVHRKFPQVAQMGKRIMWLAILATLYTVAVSDLLGLLVGYLYPDPRHPGVSRIDQYKAGLIPVVTVLAIYECVFYFRQLQLALLETEQLKKENMQSQLETLKNQVNPHFLFNSLNTLAAIIPEDPDLAVEFVQKLSKVYRYILEIRDLQTVSLRDELTAVRAYNFLLQIRFGANLTIQLDIPESRLNNRIVPLSLQMLIENAVKHNVVSTQKPLRITVFVEQDRIIVRNNLQRKNQPTDSTGLGLQNIQNRYTLLANQPVDIIVTTQAFAVSLPLLSEPAYERITN